MLPIFLLNIVNDDNVDFVEELYYRYEKRLYAIAMKYLNHHQDAQDCVHEVIRLIAANSERFREAHTSGYIEKFIGIVCRNCALNALRVKTRRSKYEVPLVRYNYEENEYEEIEIPDYSSSVDKIYISEETCEQLHGLINKLGDKYRDVVLLRSLGFDNQAIAEIMGISVELVRKRYSRAKKMLWEMGGKDLYEK